MEYTKEQLKAAAYDCIVEIERLQIQLRNINVELAKPVKEVEEVDTESD